MSRGEEIPLGAQVSLGIVLKCASDSKTLVCVCGDEAYTHEQEGPCLVGSIWEQRVGNSGQCNTD